MHSKVILLTGGTDGIGQQTALALARQGHRLLLHGRNPRRLDDAVAGLRQDTPAAEVETLCADLSSLAQVRRLGAEVNARTQRLDVLLHNAGVMMNERVLTEDGLETTFAVNHLAPFLLTHLLEPLLLRSAPSRVVVVSSVAHQRGRLHLDDLQLEHSFSPYGAYAQSKLANVLFAQELARRLAGKGVTANALHPGVIGTKLLREGFGIGGASPEEGARTSVYVATSPEVEGVSGAYFDHCKQVPTGANARDEQAQRALWEMSAKLVGIG